MPSKGTRASAAQANRGLFATRVYDHPSFRGNSIVTIVLLEFLVGNADEKGKPSARRGRKATGLSEAE